jgi:hypothetical protein
MKKRPREVGLRQDTVGLLLNLEGSANDALKAVASRTNHAERAKSLGINKHMRLSVRSQGVAEPNTLNLNVCHSRCCVAVL